MKKLTFNPAVGAIRSRLAFGATVILSAGDN